MANFGLQEFSTQEAVNFEAYTDWNWELLDLSSTATDDTSTYITGVSSLEVDDLLTMTLNGKTDAHKKIKIDPNDLPFTLTGILLTSFAIQSATGASSDSIALLSFH